MDSSPLTSGNLFTEEKMQVATLSSILSSVVKKSDDWLSLTPGSTDSKESKEEPVVGLRLLRSLFKADTPFTVRTGLFSTIAGTAGGSINSAYTVAGVASATEWSSLTTLFDEVFVHTMAISFLPRNDAGGGVGTAASGTASAMPLGGTQQLPFSLNAGLIIAALFGASATVGSAAAMLANPNRKLATSAHSWKYLWRNNVRFDPHGVTLTPLTAVGWQGWCLVGDIANYGGQVQVRAASDTLIGDQTHALTLGDLAIEWTMSFRSRV